MVRVKNQMAPVIDTENTDTPAPSASETATKTVVSVDHTNLYSFQEPEIEIKEEYFSDGQESAANLEIDDVPKRKTIGRPRKNKNSVLSVQDFASRSRSERTKKAKSIFDPSFDRIKKQRRFNNSVEIKQHQLQIKPKLDKQQPISRNRSPLNKYPRNISFNKCCYVCLKSEGLPDKICQKCETLAHSQCLEHQQNGYVVKILGSDWKCPACLLCFCCQENVNYGPLVVCNACKNAYHPNCHFPQLRNAIKPDSWMCGACTDSHFDDESSLSNELELNTLMKTSSQPSPDSPPINQEAIEKLRKWDTEDVYEYFYRYFPEISTVFREQEIDGSSILLMKRVDVLKGFKHLKLGPALNIYRHIVKLQNGGNEDPRLCWH